MQIYIHRNNEQLGPFTEAEVKAQLAAGTISPQDHVWWQGQEGWIPLAQSSLMTTPAPAVPGAPVAPTAASTPVAAAGKTSQLAIWALVCGCLSLLCGIFASIPAIILGHMGRSEIKKNPALSGGGMALAGMILGYVFTTLIVIYIVAMVVLLSMGGNVADIFKTIQAQENAALTNSVDQTTPAATNSHDTSTSSAPASTNAPDQSTNAPDQSTNSAPVSTNSPDTNTPAATPTNQ